MLISMIVALDQNGVIGVDNDLPWRLPDDLRFFRRTTLRKPVIMGRKTYESIGRPLPKRHNIVLTRNQAFSAEGVTVVHTPEAALAAVGDVAVDDVEEAVIIGGEAIYRLFLPHANRLYLTYVDTEVDGDTYFPRFDLAAWREVSREEHAADERHAYAFAWVILDRVLLDHDLNSL